MMTKDKLAELQQAGQHHVDTAKAIAQRNSGIAADNWPRQDRAAYDDALAKGREKLEAIKAAKNDLAVIDTAKDLAAEIGNPSGDPVIADGTTKVGRQLAFKRAAPAMVRRMADDDGHGRKELAVSGDAVVAQQFDASPVELGRPANSLLSVLPIRVRGGAQYSYLRQTTRTNNAAAVAEYATKPTSTYGVERVEDQLEVIAHLSEGVPRYWFRDNDLLQQFVSDEMLYGLEKAVEQTALDGIAGTSGIQSQDYATSPLATLRKSLTQLEVFGHTPSAFVMSATDWEAIELMLTSAEAVSHLSLPYDASARKLYGVPVVVSLAATEGVAHTLGDGAARLETDGEMAVQWSESSNDTDWSQNLIRARCEGRFAVSVPRPLAVVQSALVAA